MPHRAAVFTGTLFALAAGLMWGLVFVAPLMLADYPAALLTFGRYLAFGLIALPLAWLDRARVRELTRADWGEALRLALVGNIIYYLLLSAAIQRAGGPLPTMIIGTLPVVIAVCSNWRDAKRDGSLPWRRMLPSLVLIAAGIALVNQVELQHLRQGGQIDLGRYALGALLALGAVACWTWYPLRNADWLRNHPRPITHHLGHGTRHRDLAAGAAGLCRRVAVAVGQRHTAAHAVWANADGLYRLDAGHRPVRILAGYLVLERGQPTPAHPHRRAADRL